MSEVPAVPPDADAEEVRALTEARASAVDAILLAEDLEGQARRARRRATARLRYYEHLLSRRDQPVLPLTFGDAP